MVPQLRAQFNENFTEQKYAEFLSLLEGKHIGKLLFRTAETPVFLSSSFVDQLTTASNDILNSIFSEEYLKESNNAIPPEHFLPGDDSECSMLSVDFGVCDDVNGGFEPQLIELQAFPTMFYFQDLTAHAYKKAYDLPNNLTNYFNGYTSESYLSLLTEIILAGHKPQEVILLEVHPLEQKTQIDFWLTQDQLNIPIVDVLDVFNEGNLLFYKDKNGEKQQIKRIYNRMIFDDFDAQDDLKGKTIDFSKEYDVEWAIHPNLYYRFSKYALPFIKSKYAPETHFVSDLKEIPEDLENYVLKPLYSFAGQGVIIDVKKEDFDTIQHKNHWILQKKVQYADVIQTLDGKAKFEIRLMFFKSKDMEKPVLVNNLVRLSKGKMVGVRYNQDFSWVGGSIAFWQS